MSAFYYGTEECLSKKEAFHLKKYRKKASFISYANYRIDPAIFAPMNLDCKHCLKVHSSTCCENGKPYSMSKETVKDLNLHAKDIIKKHLDKERWTEALLHGYLEPESQPNRARSIKTCKGDCFFFKKTDNDSFCSIHRYAEDNGNDPIHLKPYSCTLFPLDIIQDGNEIILTVLTKETESFSRWGTQYNGYLCIDFNLRKTTNLSADYFKIKDYKPAWEWNRSLLQHSFGNDIIEAIIDVQASLDSQLLE
jgi:hypothetical protein